MQYQKSLGWTLKIVFLSTLILTGCNKKTPEETIALAKEFHAQGNSQVAVIELKNLLQEKPQQISALILLNKIYTDKKQYPAIIKLLTKPVATGIDTQEIVFSLTDALIQQAKFADALAITQSYPDHFQLGQGLALKGHIFAGLNQVVKAIQFYEQALVLNNDLISAHLGLAQEYIISTEEHKVQQASVLKRSSNNWVIKTTPVDKIGNEPTEKALEHLRKVLSLEENNVVANYLLATIYYLSKDISEAQKSINKVLEVDPEHKESLLLMGKLHLELAHIDKSEKYLKEYIKLAPKDLKARMYLSSIMLRKKQPDLALELVVDYKEEGSTDAEYLLILGNIYLAKRNNDLAIDYFAKAHDIFPQSALVKMYFAMGYLARSDQLKGDHASAIHLLEEVLAIEPDNSQAGISLITTLLQIEDYSTAILIAEAMIVRSPKSPMPWYLSGIAYQSLNKIDKAIQAFKKTLVLNHSFVPGTIRLAKIYQAQGDLSLAKKQYETGLYDSPYNAQIMTEMALLEQKAGNKIKAIELLELARDRNREALSPRLLLGTYYLRKGQVSVAKQLMAELEKLAPSRPDVQMYFGQVQLATGRVSEAVTTFSGLIQLQPSSPDILAKYGSALRLSGQLAEGRKAFESAIGLSDSPSSEVLIELAKLELTANDFQKTRDLIVKIRSNFGELASGQLLEGDLAMRLKNPSEAVNFYERANELNHATSTILKLYEAYSQAGMSDKASLFLKRSAKDNPNDLRLSMTLANIKHQQGDSEAAIEIYQGLLEQYPKNALILNNLAWVYDLTNSKKALFFAEKAYLSTPDLPQIIDSYGWFCIHEGRLKEGVSLLKTAVQKSPADPEFRYHLAEALFKSGKKGLARESLEIALASQQNFNGRNEAEDLLLKLSRSEVVTN